MRQINCSTGRNNIWRDRHSVRWLAALLVCLFFASCRDVGTIWSTESHSPDGQWIANAKTDQYGGPGTAGLQSTVSLKRVKGPKDHMMVLLLSSQDVTSIQPKLNWISSSHLEIAYKQPASIEFQAIKCAGIEITVRTLPDDSNTSSAH